MAIASSVQYDSSDIRSASSNYRADATDIRRPGRNGDVSYLAKTGRSDYLYAGDDLDSVVTQRSLHPPEHLFPGNVTADTIIGRDQRLPVIQTDVRPWSMICDLEIIDGNGNSVQGTGWMAGPRTVITSAHCVHLQSAGGWARKIRIIPGRLEDREPFGRQTSSRYSVSQQWYDDEEPRFDYAAIHLSNAFERDPGSFAFASLCNEQLKDRIINISGYPADRNGRTMWTHFDQIFQYHPYLIEYEIDVSGGQSGSPVYLFNDRGLRNPLVVAVHAYGVRRDFEANTAPRITPEVFQHFQDWLKL